ncbi:hypothetical protein VNO77_10150 [Canavalia gladiata]|uniref:Uncharacterized protein n=1 Tax=Canavalia gladiata TaxID=3824 RepID=A0AAN9MA31_CANGL
MEMWFPSFSINRVKSEFITRSGCSLVVRIPRCGRGDLGSNPSSHTIFFYAKQAFLKRQRGIFNEKTTQLSKTVLFRSENCRCDELEERSNITEVSKGLKERNEIGNGKEKEVETIVDLRDDKERGFSKFDAHGGYAQNIIVITYIIGYAAFISRELIPKFSSFPLFMHAGDIYHVKNTGHSLLKATTRDLQKQRGSLFPLIGTALDSLVQG